MFLSQPPVQGQKSQLHVFSVKNVLKWMLTRHDQHVNPPRVPLGISNGSLRLIILFTLNKKEIL